MHFNAFNKSSFHFRNPSTYASAIFQPCFDDVHLFNWRGNSAFTFLLKSVKDKHCLGKLDRKHGAVSTINIVFNY